MPRGKSAEIFECPTCGNKQPLNKAAHRSVNCIGCGTSFAIVRDGDGDKALVPFFNQESASHEKQSK